MVDGGREKERGMEWSKEGFENFSVSVVGRTYYMYTNKVKLRTNIHF